MTTLKIVSVLETQTIQEHSYAARLAAFAMRIVLWPVRVSRARKVMNHLASMSEHQLRDIGLTRSDIHSARAVALDEDPTLFLEQRSRERAAARRAERATRRKPYY